MKTIEIHRNNLYKEVWQTPILQLAKKYGISDVGLKKICKKLDVPAPPRGYWAKVANNHKVRRTPLPRLKRDTPTEHIIQKDNVVKEKITKDDPIKEYLDFEDKPENQIKVPDRLGKKHPVIVEIEKPFDEKYQNYYDYQNYHRRTPAMKDISKDQYRRAVLILNSLLWALEKRNFLYTEREEAGLELFDQKVIIVIREIRLMKKNDDPDAWRKTELIPSGKLCLEIKNWGSLGLRKKWCDTKTKVLEQYLNDVVKGMIRFAYYLQIEQLNRIERDRIWKLENKLRGYIDDLVKIKNHRIDVLYKQACDWRASQLYEQFINDVDNCVNDLRLEKERELKYNKWRDFAISQMEMLNPIKPNNMPFDNFDIHIDEKIEMIKKQLRELKVEENKIDEPVKNFV